MEHRPETHNVAWNDLELQIFHLPPSEFCDYRGAPPYPVYVAQGVEAQTSFMVNKYLASGATSTGQISC